MNTKTKMIAVLSALVIGTSSLYADEIQAVYEKSCAACHGKDGKGDTAVGKKLKLKDWTDAKVQEAETDEQIFKAIKEGVKKDDKVRMKAFGDKLTDEQIKALVAYMRAFKK